MNEPLEQIRRRVEQHISLECTNVHNLVFINKTVRYSLNLPSYLLASWKIIHQTPLWFDQKNLFWPGDHGNQSSGHPRSGPSQAWTSGPQDWVPFARPSPEATCLFDHHLKDEPFWGGWLGGLCRQVCTSSSTLKYCDWMLQVMKMVITNNNA